MQNTHTLTHRLYEPSNTRRRKTKGDTQYNLHARVYSCMRMSVVCGAPVCVWNENVMSKKPPQQYSAIPYNTVRGRESKSAVCMYVSVYSVNVLCMWKIFCLLQTVKLLVCVSFSFAPSFFVWRSLFRVSLFVYLQTRYMYGGIPFVSSLCVVFFFHTSSFSYEFRYFIARYKIFYFSFVLRLSFSLVLTLFSTYAPVAYLCQSTNEEKMFFLLLNRANIQLNSQYI